MGNINQGEYQKLDLSGWVVLSNLIGPGDQVIVRKDGIGNLWERDVEGIIRKISSNNLVAMDITTPGVEEPHGWLDIMWALEVLVYPPLGEITLVRNDGKHWMLQGPYKIDLEKETATHYFGWAQDAPFRRRVWDRHEWTVLR